MSKEHQVERRDWSKAYEARRNESEQIDTLMRSILKMFADGQLIYRERTSRSAPVSTQSTRLKRLRSSVSGGSPAVA